MPRTRHGAQSAQRTNSPRSKVLIVHSALVTNRPSSRVKFGCGVLCLVAVKVTLKPISASTPTVRSMTQSSGLLIRCDAPVFEHGLKDPRIMGKHPWNIFFLVGFVIYVVIRGVFKQRVKGNEMTLRKVDALEK